MIDNEYRFAELLTEYAQVRMNRFGRGTWLRRGSHASYDDDLGMWESASGWRNDLLKGFNARQSSRVRLDALLDLVQDVAPR